MGTKGRSIIGLDVDNLQTLLADLDLMISPPGRSRLFIPLKR